jgi:hypothetical protein
MQPVPLKYFQDDPNPPPFIKALAQEIAKNVEEPRRQCPHDRSLVQADSGAPAIRGTRRACCRSGYKSISGAIAEARDQAYDRAGAALRLLAYRQVETHCSKSTLRSTRHLTDLIIIRAAAMTKKSARALRPVARRHPAPGPGRHSLLFPVRRWPW